jgi:hypothetical protein
MRTPVFFRTPAFRNFGQTIDCRMTGAGGFLLIIAARFAR